MQCHAASSDYTQNPTKTIFLVQNSDFLSSLKPQAQQRGPVALLSILKYSARRNMISSGVRLQSNQCLELMDVTLSQQRNVNELKVNKNTNTIICTFQDVGPFVSSLYFQTSTRTLLTFRPHRNDKAFALFSYAYSALPQNQSLCSMLYARTLLNYMVSLLYTISLI